MTDGELAATSPVNGRAPELDGLGGSGGDFGDMLGVLGAALTWEREFSAEGPCLAEWFGVKVVWVRLDHDDMGGDGGRQRHQKGEGVVDVEHVDG